MSPSAVLAAPPTEIEFMRALAIALSDLPGVRVHRQNTGSVAFLQRGQKRTFHAGPPEGAADLSGIVAPEGWRLEIECKGVRTATRKAQARWAAHILDSGGVYLCVRVRPGDTLDSAVQRGVALVDDAIRARRSLTVRREAG